jgi:hypothetical protein
MLVRLRGNGHTQLARKCANVAGPPATMAIRNRIVEGNGQPRVTLAVWAIGTPAADFESDTFEKAWESPSGRTRIGTLAHMQASTNTRKRFLRDRQSMGDSRLARFTGNRLGAISLRCDSPNTGLIRGRSCFFLAVGLSCDCILFLQSPSPSKQADDIANAGL